MTTYDYMDCWYVLYDEKCISDISRLKSHAMTCNIAQLRSICFSCGLLASDSYI